MNDLTLIYYTANLVEDPFGSNVRNHLLSLFPEGVNVISVSQKPMSFGKNICVSDFVPSIYNIYRQILIGAKAATTPYIACCEDDSLYTREHFEYRPKDDGFAYNLDRWVVNKDLFFWRNRIGMCMCIAPTQLMIDTLELRFKKFPKIMSREEMGAAGGFGEPGKFEERYGLPKVKVVKFNTTPVCLVFNHRPSMGGVRKLMDKDKLELSLPHWGKASDLWRKFYGSR